MTVAELIAQLQSQPLEAVVLIDYSCPDIEVEKLDDFYGDGRVYVCLTT